MIKKISQALAFQINTKSSPIKQLLHFSRFCFSLDQNNSKIVSILNQIHIQVNNEKKSILESGLISGHRFDEESNKVILSLSTNKDFAKIKNHLKKVFGSKGYQNVQILHSQKQDRKMFQRKGNLNKINKIIAVSSCKGGVGKSTIAVNLAYELKQQGHKVGIFDADVYGPSLPTLVGRQGHTISQSKQNSNNTLPLQVDGVSCMSFGFVHNKPSTMRGPMASSIISQLLLQTEWGSLDFLIVDMPPGTGDVNLSLCEELKFDGAVIVTTPQRLSFIDVMKGIQMFQDLKVRILGIIQNMSYYSCKKCGTIDQIFGQGHNKIIMDQLGIDNSFKIPLNTQFNLCCDTGNPAVVVLPQGHFIREMYTLICASLKTELQKQKSKAGAFYDTTSRLVVVEEDKKQKKINPVLLRSKCKCKECVSDLTGELKIDIKNIDPEVYPVKIEQKGNYAVGIAWSDGHKDSIYSYRRLFSDQIPSK